MMLSPPLTRTNLQHRVRCRQSLFQNCLFRPALLFVWATCFAALGCGSLNSVRQSVEVARSVAIESHAASLPDVPVFDQEATVARVATSKPAAGLIAAVKPFRWELVGESAGRQKFQRYTAGKDGFRSVVIGSVGGNDPAAIRLIDELAMNLHQQDLIVGGFHCTIVRTLNPDGHKSGQFVNGRQEYVNNFFPNRLPSGSVESSEFIPEVKFALKQFQEDQPQRIVHIRTIKSSRGIIAASSGAQRLAAEMADWLQFDVKLLPGTAAEGSLERMISSSAGVEMVTVAIPELNQTTDVWAAYGDTILNLLLADDFQTRELARRRRNSSSADARYRDPANP